MEETSLRSLFKLRNVLGEHMPKPEIQILVCHSWITHLQLYKFICFDL